MFSFFLKIIHWWCHTDLNNLQRQSLLFASPIWHFKSLCKRFNWAPLNNFISQTFLSIRWATSIKRNKWWRGCFWILAEKQHATWEGITSENYRKFNWRLLDLFKLQSSLLTLANVRHYLPNDCKSTFDESLARLCFAKLTKNRFLLLLLPTATSTCRDCHDFSFGTACSFAYVFRVREREKKKEKLPSHSTTPVTQISLGEMTWIQTWLNTRKGKLWADKASSKGIYLRLPRVFWCFTQPWLVEHIKFTALPVQYH